MKIPMKKEIILAIVLGLSFGLVITYGVYRANLSMTQQPHERNQTSTPTPSPDSTADNANLSLISPEDESVVTDSALTVAGKTFPNAYVVIFINDIENLTTADDQGNFSITGELELGSNFIITHVIDDNGVTTTQERTVILTTVAASPAASASATPQ